MKGSLAALAMAVLPFVAAAETVPLKIPVRAGRRGSYHTHPDRNNGFAQALEAPNIKTTHAARVS